jgi:hypothetical protein
MSKPSKGKVTWDERGIENDNIERGTREKIDEPKTPYHTSMVFDEGLFLQ